MKLADAIAIQPAKAGGVALRVGIIKSATVVKVGHTDVSVTNWTVGSGPTAGASALLLLSQGIVIGMELKP